MHHHLRALAVLLTSLAVAAGCARAAREPRVSEAPPPPPAAAATPAPAGTPATAALAPIPGHPPVTASGVVNRFDPATGIVTFTDGRMVKLTDQSKVLQAVEWGAMRPGEPVIVRSALPVGVQPAATTSPGGAGRAAGTHQRMGTVASVDPESRLVRLTDGSAIRVTPSTQMHMGTTGTTIVLTDLRPGDELVIVIADGATRSAAGTAGAGSAAPSALPREVMMATPSDVAELMVFRPQAP